MPINNYLDESGIIKTWPSKRKRTQQLALLSYLATKFDYEREYSEVEVNQIIIRWHHFGDHVLLRRGMVDSGVLNRDPAGRIYKRVRVDKK